MLELYTVQLYKANAIDDPEVVVIDSTVKTGHRELAPNWDMVMGFKSGELSWDCYTREYLSMMGQSLMLNPRFWFQTFPNRSMKIAIGCYCRPGDNCHRHLLKEFIMDWKMSEGLEVVDMGEI